MPQRNVILYDPDRTIIPWDTRLVFRSDVLRREPWRGPLTADFLAFLPLNKVLGTVGMKRVFHCWKNRLPFGIGCARQLFGLWKP